MTKSPEKMTKKVEKQTKKVATENFEKMHKKTYTKYCKKPNKV
jgi:hypothetical protein